MRFLLPLLFAASTAAALDTSIEVRPDRSVSFAFDAPKAQSVTVSGDFGERGVLTKDDAGVWRVTLGPLAPNIYSYVFTVDGRPAADPLNTRVKPQRSGVANVLEVPADAPSVWDRQPGVPHGVVHLHEYDSRSLGVVRRMRVYTPPGYAASATERFPVLFLFHGSGDNEATWTEFGRAHVILDNLIAAGKAQPMIVVMTDGHTAPPVPRDSPKAAEARNKNVVNFERDFLEDAMPLADALYRTRTEPANRAIIGLSMGGNQSLIIGLNHLDKFAWVGGMSSAVREPDTQLAPFFKDVASAGERLKLLWFACGKDDFLLKENQKLDTMLTEKQVKHTYVESAGGHSWPVWRRYLAEFAPLLFQSK
jgi:enterochelin esterase family protein